MSIRMGGYVSASYLVPDSILSMAVFGGMASIFLQSGASWNNLSISFMGINPTDECENGLHTQNIEIKVMEDDELLLSRLNFVARTGVVLKLRSAMGKDYIFGSKEYPLTGTFCRNDGSHPEDGRSHLLTLTGKLPHSPLLIRG